MKKNYTSIIVLITVLFFGDLSAQETQKNFINYQGVARNASSELMADANMSITIGLKFGGANTTAVYQENHNITTDTNGVFSLLIGNGSATQGNYNNLPWGSAATFVTVAINGSVVGTTELMAVPYAISSGNADDQSADEVLYDNSVSGLSAMTAQEAIDELITGGSVDADPDPSNELQLLSFDSATNELNISDGNTVTIPSGGTDADADPTNELQDISLAGTELTITEGSTIDLAPIVPPGGTDNQELTFNIATKILEIEDGNTVDLSSLSGGGTGSSLWSENAGDIYYNSGKVGIGTTSPSSPLEIVSGSDSPILLESTRSDGNGWIRYNNDTGRVGYTGMFNGTRDMELGTSASNATGNVHLTIGGTPKLTVVPNGNVGIGTQSPSSPLEIVSGSDSPILLESTRSDGNGWIRYNNDTGRVGYTGMFNGTRDMELGTSASNATGNVHLTIGGTPKLTVVPNGNVGIGTQSPSSPLEIVSGSDSPILLESTRSDGNGWIRFNNDTGRVGYAGMFNGTRDMELGTSGSNPTGRVHLTIGGSPKLTVAANGNIIVDGSVVHSSDRRLKRDIIMLPYGIETIMQLSPKAYYWKKDKTNGTRALGLIAQEVEPIIKEVVHRGRGEEDTLSISYTELVPVLIKAIQEQQAIIVGQSTKISDFEVRLAKLETKL